VKFEHPAVVERHRQHVIRAYEELQSAASDAKQASAWALWPNAREIRTRDLRFRSKSLGQRLAVPARIGVPGRCVSTRATEESARCRANRAFGYK
jgi:hypothetical protein